MLKMIINILRAAIFLFCINIASQTQINSKYEFKYYASINTHILEEYTGYLYFNKSNSIFYWEMKGNNSLKSTSEGNFTRAEHLKDGEFNYLEKGNKKIISKAVVSKSEHHYVEQENPDFNWEIYEESEIIVGYVSYKATTNYMGRKYTVWFTKEIPVPYGPWKLNGLPGLILKAYDTSKEITFSITEINKKDLTKKISYKDKNLISLNDYYQRMVDYPFEQLRIAQSKAPKGSSISITNIKYNFIEKDFEVLGKKEFKNK